MIYNDITSQYNAQIKTAGGYDKGYQDGFKAGVAAAQERLTQDNIFLILLRAASGGHGLDNRRQAEELASFIISQLVIPCDD